MGAGAQYDLSVFLRSRILYRIARAQNQGENECDGGLLRRARGIASGVGQHGGEDAEDAGRGPLAGVHARNEPPGEYQTGSERTGYRIPPGPRAEGGSGARFALGSGLAEQGRAGGTEWLANDSRRN